MSKFLLFILCIALSVIGFGRDEDSAWVCENYYKVEQQIPMRDGKKLFTAIYIPKDTATLHPILFSRTPYSCRPYGREQFNPRLYSTYWINYLKQGYIMAFQDVRGRWMSEGDFVDVRPFNPNKKGTDTDEASDTYDAIDWLINNVPKNNKRVGVFGISYPGFYSTMASLCDHPALKAVSPQAPVTDWFMGDDFHHNGAFMLMDAFNFYSGFGKPRPRPTQLESSGFKFPNRDNYEFYLRTGAVKNFTRLMGDTIAFWKDMMAHPNYDGWWKARDVRNFVTNIKPAVLVVGGLFDAEDCFGAWNLYKAIEQKSRNTDNRVVMGPWYHGGWSRADGKYLGNIRFGSATSEKYQRDIEIPFFNFYLRLNGTVREIAEATVFFTGEDKWRGFTTWPPAKMVQRELLLSQNGQCKIGPVYDEQLAKRMDKSENFMETHGAFDDKKNKKQPAPGSFSEYLSDPARPVPYTQNVHMGRTREYMTDDQRFASRRPDVLCFVTEPLNSDISLAGPVIADLLVSLSTTDADFIVKLIDVFPDDFSYDFSLYGPGNGQYYPMEGYQMLVRGEVMRGKFRNSFEKPEAFVPGKISRVKYALPDVAHTFKKGHRIMIQIQSSWFPLVDRNPQKFTDIYNCADSDFQKSTIRIWHDAANQSKIILPVLN